MSSAIAVMAYLADQGWVEDGATLERTSRTPIHYANPRVTRIPARQRFVSPDGAVKVTVGQRTTCFYLPQTGKPYHDWPFVNVKTSELSRVQQLATNRRALLEAMGVPS